MARAQLVGWLEGLRSQIWAVTAAKPAGREQDLAVRPAAYGLPVVTVGVPAPGAASPAHPRDSTVVAMGIPRRPAADPQAGRVVGRSGLGFYQVEVEQQTAGPPGPADAERDPGRDEHIGPAVQAAAADHAVPRVDSLISQASRLSDVHHARYRGKPKTFLQHTPTAMAINLIRLDAWLIGIATTEAGPPDSPG